LGIQEVRRFPIPQKKGGVPSPLFYGYELDKGHLGVLAVGEASMHQALLIPDWGKTTFFTNGVFEPNEGQIKQLEARQVTIEREIVLEVFGKNASVKLRDGRVVELAGLFVASKTKVSSPLAEQLGCEFTESPLGPYIKTDGFKETSVTGVFACGDAARAAGNISFAIADGVLAATAAHRSLIFGELV
jgi:thioredoxin reductase